MARILLCEDEDAIREFVMVNLRRAGHEVIEAASGEEALQKFEAAGSVDLALLDVMLPGMDGFAVCRALRRQDGRMGIIMLTARTQESDKIGGLAGGADDYVTKPFSPTELLARIEALLRRVNAARPDEQFSEKLSSGGFVLDRRRHMLSCGEVSQELTQLEFQVLEYLFQNAGKAVSRDQILDHVWGEDYVGDEKIVDVNIRRLRMKVEQDPSAPQHIVTVWGKGYKWLA